MAFTSIAALYFGLNSLSYVMALGIFFLPARLHLMVRSLVRAIPDDMNNSSLTNYFKGIRGSNVDCYIMLLNIENIHNFILPTHALPFWDLRDVERWLCNTGFKKSRGGNWIGDSSILKLLEFDEVIEIEPCLENDVPV